MDCELREKVYDERLLLIFNIHNLHINSA